MENNNLIIYILIGIVFLLVVAMFFLRSGSKKQNNTGADSIGGMDKRVLDQFYEEIGSLKSEREILKKSLQELEHNKQLPLHVADNNLLSKLSDIEQDRDSLLLKVSTLKKDYEEKINLLEADLIESTQNVAIQFKKGENVLSEKLKVIQTELQQHKDDVDKYKLEIEDYKTREIEFKSSINTYKNEVEGYSMRLNESNLVVDKYKKDIENFKLEIDSLEEDVEDLEDEVDKLQDEIEVEKVKTGSLDLALKELKSKTDNEIEKLQGNLLKREEILSQRENSLKFINEILDAQDTVEEDETLSNLQFYILEEVFGLFKIYYEDEYIDWLEGNLWSWGNLEKKTWLKKKKVIAIVGEFSAGKTSIVNRILSQDDPNAVLLPVSSKETTAIPTYISEGQEFSCEFYSPVGTLNPIEKETFEMVTKSVLDNVKALNLIKYFVVKYKNPHLKNISILDTPGFGSNSLKIRQRTTDVVRESSAVFWVIDANTGDVNQSSLDVLKQELHDIPLYIIINKADTKSPSDLRTLEKKITETLNRNNISFKSLILFSQRSNIDVLMKKIQEIDVDFEGEDIIDIISKDLVEIREDLLEQLKISSKNDTILKGNIKISENTFLQSCDDMDYSVSELKQCVKFKDSFWGSDYYKIEQSDYTYFTNNLTDILNISEAIKKGVPEYKLEVEDSVQVGIDLQQRKNYLEQLDKVERKFLKLLKEYRS